MIFNVLIVDDREFDRILYKEYLGNDNYVYSELDDGEHILQVLESTSIDLILLDWQMPRVNGLETLKTLKNHKDYKEIPIMVITGLRDESVMEKVFDFGGVDFINKPVSSIEINSRVKSSLNLNQAKKDLQEQKKQLEKMNAIIRVQKEELEKTLVIKQELTTLKEQKLYSEIQSTKRQLMSFELESTKIYKGLAEMKNEFKNFLNLLTQEDNKKGYRSRITKLIKNIELLSATQDSLDNFKKVFENIDPKFFAKLTKVNPKLTTLDFKHCAYIKLNLDNFEISNILNVEPKSIQMTRYRIKKKLKLEENTSLKEFILSL